MTATLKMRPRIAQKDSKKYDGAIILFVALLTACILFAVFSPVIAANDMTLTDAFQTKSFRGSAEALSQANFIGQILHYVISWFSFLGLCLTLYQKFITLLYLSARNLFDTIYEVKMEKMKGSFLGYKELFTGLFKDGDNSKAGGGGLDVFITFFYSLLPNVKAYCDLAPGKAGSFGKDDEERNNVNVTSYMLKTALPTIILIFFLTIGS